MLAADGPVDQPHARDRIEEYGVALPGSADLAAEAPAVAEVGPFLTAVVELHMDPGLEGDGLLWLKRGTAILPQMHGGTQERYRRAGTEDVAAAVDMNLVMTSKGEFVEVQGTGEEATFTEDQLAVMLRCGRAAMAELVRAQPMLCNRLVSEAKQLLDAQKGNEQVLQFKPQGKPEDQNRPIKDW